MRESIRLVTKPFRNGARGRSAHTAAPCRRCRLDSGFDRPPPPPAASRPPAPGPTPTCASTRPKSAGRSVLLRRGNSGSFTHLRRSIVGTESTMTGGDGNAGRDFSGPDPPRAERAAPGKDRVGGSRRPRRRAMAEACGSRPRCLPGSRRRTSAAYLKSLAAATVLSVPHLILPATPAGAACETGERIDHRTAELPTARALALPVTSGGLHIDPCPSREAGALAARADIPGGRWGEWPSGRFAQPAGDGSAWTGSRELTGRGLVLVSSFLSAARGSAAPGVRSLALDWGPAASMRVALEHGRRGDRLVGPFGAECGRSRPLAPVVPSYGIGEGGIGEGGSSVGLPLRARRFVERRASLRAGGADRAASRAGRSRLPERPADAGRMLRRWKRGSVAAPADGDRRVAPDAGPDRRSGDARRAGSGVGLRSASPPGPRQGVSRSPSRLPRQSHRLERPWPRPRRAIGALFRKRGEGTMLSDDLRGLVIQGRRHVRDPMFLVHLFDRLDEAAAQLETLERSAVVVLPSPPDNVVPFSEMPAAPGRLPGRLTARSGPRGTATRGAPNTERLPVNAIRSDRPAPNPLPSRRAARGGRRRPRRSLPRLRAPSGD